jgi:hypothetical protein
MYLVSALEMSVCVSHVPRRRYLWRQTLPRFALRGQLLTRS